MKIFLVGGAVRDKLLNLPVKDHDWVVVGSSPEEMKSQGFQPVGQDFPVFLHPQSKEEYALARTERKSGHGYGGFVFHTAPDVTLEEDLIRRDLTINAMAEDSQGQLHDPYGGKKDLENRLLRHVSSAFQEDPLRILRVARFAARFHHLGFKVAPETLQLMTRMVESGEASYLVPERVWQETVRALSEPSPQIYFEVLFACNAMSVVMPDWIPFISAPATGLKALEAAVKEGKPEEIRFAATFSTESGLNVEQIKSLSKHLKVPSSYTELASLTFQYSQTVLDNIASIDAEFLMTLFEQTDAFRRPERFTHFLEACSCIATAKEQELSAEACSTLQSLLELCLSINARDIVAQGFKGKAVGEQLRKLRVEQMQEKLKQ
ncbi:multifunctional CCA addition/repair protein [Endozoicomonas arenosclerae]|uniref:multifunctional CCA addition/repair protein n=1 Tax=Endozoicomonas arenosclerae TaxID=1633495 RepID=UPI000782D639|nr:multifunctional CCA addition/repair protein [Endozoicomonas arenosclerae]